MVGPTRDDHLWRAHGLYAIDHEYGPRQERLIDGGTDQEGASRRLH